MKKRFVKTPFTLLEIIVSMAVFSILVVVMMQFFTGARRIWVGTENKNETYSDARAAMNLMSNLLQNTFYSAGEDMNGRIPFRISHNSDPYISDKIYFVSRSPFTVVPNTTYNLSFILIQRESAATSLKILGASDPESGFANIFNTTNAAWGGLFGAADAYTKKATVIDRVVNIKFFPGMINTATTPASITWLTETATTADHTIQGVPDVIRIELTVIDKEGFDKWVAKGGGDPESTDAALREFRKPFERKFTRVIHLKSRNYAP